MPQLKYFDVDNQEWKVLSVDGNHIKFSQGEYSGKSLLQVIAELKRIAAGGSITRNTFDFHIIKIKEDGQAEVPLPVRINPQTDAFLLFLNPGVLSTDSYSLSNTGDSILLKGELYAGDELYLVIFKTVRAAPPDNYDGIIIVDGTIQEGKLAPTVQKKINDAIPSSEKGISLATLVKGKVPAEQLPNLAPLNHSHSEYALSDHTHDNLASAEALRTHVENETLHITTNEKEALQHIQYNNEKKYVELENTKVNGNLYIQDCNVLDSIKKAQEKPTSNSKSIIVSKTEPTDPNENDIWIVI